ncbi:hypothetical protein CEXT_621241 [Caerostris extrusa]|uniref:Uncharacterized protein n=1 Tax=Caerostris extrusa TaxID=172846 RepID=A0AAV4WLJ9_CAEEX|nr:hypothetical protein CEXT_621241 [Caerostris extrusa]
MDFQIIGAHHPRRLDSLPTLRKIFCFNRLDFERSCWIYEKNMGSYKRCVAYGKSLVGYAIIKIPIDSVHGASVLRHRRVEEMHQ